MTKGKRNHVIVRRRASGVNATPSNVRDVKSTRDRTSRSVNERSTRGVSRRRPPAASRKRPTLPRKRGVVSVLMTAYKTEEWLDQAVASVLEQEGLPNGWEVELCIGVDADPKTLRAALRFADHPCVRVVEFGANAGTYRCLNALAERATGELLAILDSDDLAKPGRLAAQVRAFLDDPSLDFVAGRNDVLEGGRLTPGATLDRQPSIADVSSYPLHSTWCFRRSLFDELGGYQGWRCGADTDFWIRVLASKARALVLSSILSTHRRRAGQLTGAGTSTGPGSQVRQKAQRSINRDTAAYKSGSPVRVAARAANPVKRVHGAPLRVVVLMPTIPSRARTARLVAQNMLRQGVSKLVVHLNGHGSVPDWAIHPRVEAIRNPAGTGPLVRWSKIPESDYVLAIDDDLMYPSDYVASMIRHLQLLGHGAAISMHATHWPRGKTALEDRVILSFAASSSKYAAKTYLGCGASGFHGSDLIRVDRQGPKMFDRLDDVWISGAVARAGLRLYRPPSSERWIKSYPEQNEGIYANEMREKFKSRKRALQQAMKLGGWNLTPTHGDI